MINVYEVEVVSGLLFKFRTDGGSALRNSAFKFGRYASHIKNVRQNALNYPIWLSYCLTNFMDSLPTICKEPSYNL